MGSENHSIDTRCDELWSLIRADIAIGRTKVKDHSALTIGLEVEFFLVSSCNELATLAESSAFISELASHRGWSLTSDLSHIELPVSAASRELGEGRYTKLKFEYPPHLLEVAFSYYHDLNRLYDEIRIVQDDLNFAANSIGLKVEIVPFGDPEKAINVPIATEKIAQLNRSRIDYSRNLGIFVEPEVAFFPSYMAGTQIHLGGLNWWDNESVISKLYYFESWFPLVGAFLSCSDPVNAVFLARKRARLYQTCFPEMKLVAFPNLDEWTLNNWLLALLDSPPISITKAINCQRSPYGRADDAKPMSLIYKTFRDLQYIRPRYFGTIEFRADPAIPDAANLACLGAWRLAQACIARSSSISANLSGFGEMRRIWEDNSSVPLVVPCENSALLIQRAIDALKSRSLGEEKLLRPLA